MGAFAERHYPWLGGMISGGICYLLLRHWTIPPGTKDLLAGLLNVAAIMVGFLVTAKSILLSIDDRWIIKRSKEAGAFEMLVGYMVAATYWWLGTALLSALGVAMIPSSLADWQKIIAVRMFAVWVFVAATSVLAAFRVLTIYSSILRSISKG